MTAGFYKLENGELNYAPTFVEGSGYVLLATEKDNYSYPIYGWWWFDSREEAEAHYLNLNENSVTPRQFRLSLLHSGIDPDDITAMLANNKEGLIEWNYASSIKRDHPLVSQLAIALGLNSSEVDNIFENAKQY